MLVLVTVMSLGNVPPPNLVRATLSFANLEPWIFALAFTSASTIDPSTMLAELTVIPDLSRPSAILLLSIAALALMSALTIVLSLIFAEVTAPSMMSSSVTF